MIEPEAVIDPETVAPGPPTSRRRRAVVAGVTLLAVLAGAIAVAGGGGSDPEPLALMTGNGAGFGAETMAGKDAGSPVPAVAPAQGLSADRAMAPYGGWGMKFEVEGQLPALPDHANAWRVNGPALDRAAIARIAEALGVQGAPVPRDGGWFVESGDWSLSAYGGDAMGKGGNWYLNLYRARFNGAADDAPANDPPAGPAISRADAERRVRDLLDRMGAPRASWKVETTDTEIGVGWACAAPAPSISPEELKRMEAEKLRQIERENPAGSSASGSGTAASPGTAAPDAAVSGNATAPASTPAAMPLPADKPLPAEVPSCPPPPAPVKGFTVALYPVLDGRRADWPIWNVTMRSDGRIENLSGSWVNFERAGDYKLRGVDAALKDLQSPPIAYATDMPATATEPATPPPAQTSAGVVEGSAGSAGSDPSRMPLKDDVASYPIPDIAPCPPIPVEDGKSVSSPMIGCAQPVPQVVKITGVELGLIQTSVFENGQVRLAMVPSYRFTGHLDNGSPWETSVVALHRDAIAPPPAYPVDGDVRSGGGVTGVGKAVPPTPPADPVAARE